MTRFGRHGTVLALASLAAAFLSPSVGRAQQNAWIYEIFVKECTKTGGRPGSSLDQFVRGEKFVCAQGGTGRSTQGVGGSCEKEAKIGVDWVFADRGAHATYDRNRASGRNPFDAAVAAQGHNPHAQQVLRSCRSWVESYLADRGGTPSGQAAEPALPSRPLGAGDCSCISVIPSGVRRFQVTNRCDAMKVAVHFGGDIAHLSPSTDALTSRDSTGTVSPGHDGSVRAPAHWTLASITAVTLENSASTVTCRF